MMAATMDSYPDPLLSFTDAMRDAGYDPGAVIPDGTLHRFRHGDQAGCGCGWYVLHLDGIPAGCYGDWRSGQAITWCGKSEREFSAEEKAEYRRRLAEQKKIREEAKTRQHAETAAEAKRRWDAAEAETGEHPYLRRKRVQAYGLRHEGDLLLVPMLDASGLSSLQTIDPEGRKLFLPGGRKKGCCFSIKGGSDTYYICEGYATGATIHEATGGTVLVAFDAGNLLPVAEAVRAKHSEAKIVMCADDDRWKPEVGNAGIEKGKAAAAAVGGDCVSPRFQDLSTHPTDFNDLAVLEGIEAVRLQLRRLGWPDPQPIITSTPPAEYPLGALPDPIREAIEEVQNFVQAPIPLVASSALAVLSLAVQGHIDIERARQLSGPCSLSLLTIAESGERKTTVDGIFTRPIREYTSRKAEEAKIEYKRYEATKAAWDAKKGALLEAIKKATKDGRSTTEIEDRLEELHEAEPTAPGYPRLLLVDETPESLLRTLARVWPSSGVISSEAGVVFGAHGMNSDNVMRNLAQLNVLWDGGVLDAGRKVAESIRVDGARLTLGLQVQEATLRTFFNRSNGLARGTGFLARFLISWPESTMGTRAFAEAPETWPAMRDFSGRVLELLHMPLPTDDTGRLTPLPISMDPDAKAAWIRFHDTVEHELRCGGELCNIQDVASKAADNAARMAALFHTFINGPTGSVGLETLQAAVQVVSWHLNEALRFFGEIALPAELTRAARLDEWLLDYCDQNDVAEIPTRIIQQYAPGGVREKENLRSALSELSDLDRLRVVRDGKRKIVRINPVLLEGIR